MDWGQIRRRADVHSHKSQKLHNPFKTQHNLKIKRTKMRKQWKNHDIDLKRLAEAIQNQYKGRNLILKTTDLKNGYKIRIVLRIIRNPPIMDITVKGNPNDFTIETKAAEYEDEALKIGLFTQIFGGGNLILGNIKAREEEEKLENEFWTKIEEIIATLTNRAQPQ